MLIAQKITYLHPDKELLFEDISLSIQKNDKVALVGNNGSGKSTLLKVLAQILRPAKGTVRFESTPYYIPQHFGQFNDTTVAQALHIDRKLKAFSAILKGEMTDENLADLADDWTIEERYQEALSFWNLHDVTPDRKMELLSGGEKTKVFLAGIMIHQPDIVLLDEPTNHLDTASRETFYNYLTSCQQTLVVVSHDRTLLELLNPVYELERHAIKVYGGNYSFYKEQKELEENALIQQLEEKEKALHKARKAERETLERKQRQDARGKKKHEKEGVARIMMKTLRNNAEESAARLKDVHAQKQETLAEEMKQVQQKLPANKRMKMDFVASGLREGKMLVTAKDINYEYTGKKLWQMPLSFQIKSGERIRIKGRNGSGKTTLIRITLGELRPSEGTLSAVELKSVYIDQDYSLIRDDFSIYDQAQLYNDDALPEHEIKIRLHRYLFTKEYWDKPCGTLSGGEKMRLMLCCLMISNHAPDLFVLDEPTNS
ncbi:MAG TPA: ABC-F family ATP-binding cassette domain-containing protein, partial [Bacteroidales bacterium]|nr:ABC-F family ATP-binding cassette domain-containing protein [Bacteroidales bacterium]